MNLQLILVGLFLSVFWSTDFYANQASFVNVLDFGATPNDESDDTEAFKSALEFVKSSGSKHLFIPKGVYFVDTIRLDYAISFSGEEGTVLKKICNADKWSRMITIVRDNINPKRNYLISKIEFDGNLINQGEYSKYQLEQQHLIFIAATNDREERVQVDIDNCFFKNSVADGITVFRNAEVTITNCKAKDIFRGAFVSNGGNSKIKIKNFEVIKGDIIKKTGFDIEVIGDRFYGNKKVEIEYDNIILQGKFHIAINDGSLVKATNIKSENTEFYIVGTNSQIKICNSDFKLNPNSKNRIYHPSNVVIENSIFFLNDDVKEDTSLLTIFWMTKKNQFKNNKLVFNKCTFTKSGKNNNGAVFSTETDNLMNNNLLEINDCKLDSSFKNGLLMKRGGRFVINNGEWNPEVPLQLTSQSTKNRQLVASINNVKFHSSVKIIINTTANKGDVISFKNLKSKNLKSKINIKGNQKLIQIIEK